MGSSVAAPGWGTARAPPPLFYFFSPTSGTFPFGFGSQQAGFPSRETSRGRDGHQGGCCWGCPLGTGLQTQPHGAGGAFQLRSGGDAHKRVVPLELFASPSLPLALSPCCGEASSFCHSTLCPINRSGGWCGVPSPSPPAPGAPNWCPEHLGLFTCRSSAVEADFKGISEEKWCFGARPGAVQGCGVGLALFGVLPAPMGIAGSPCSPCSAPAPHGTAGPSPAPLCRDRDPHR